MKARAPTLFLTLSAIILGACVFETLYFVPRDYTGKAMAAGQCLLWFGAGVAFMAFMMSIHIQVRRRKSFMPRRVVRAFLSFIVVLGILVSVMVLSVFPGKPEPDGALPFGTVGIGLAVSAFFIKRWFFPGDPDAEASDPGVEADRNA